MNRKELPQPQENIYKTLTTNIILNGKTMNIFPPRSGTSQISFDIGLKFQPA